MRPHLTNTVTISCVPDRHDGVLSQRHALFFMHTTVNTSHTMLEMQRSATWKAIYLYHYRIYNLCGETHKKKVLLALKQINPKTEGGIFQTLSSHSDQFGSSGIVVPRTIEIYSRQSFNFQVANNITSLST